MIKRRAVPAFQCREEGVGGQQGSDAVTQQEHCSAGATVQHKKCIRVLVDVVDGDLTFVSVVDGGDGRPGGDVTRGKTNARAQL